VAQHHRSVDGVSFFWAIARLPLAEAIGLSFIAPVIALYLAAIMLGETNRARGDTGIGRRARRGWRDPLWEIQRALFKRCPVGALAVLFSAVLFAYNLILARQQAQAAGPIEIAFFQNLLTASVLALAAPWFLAPLGGGQGSDAVTAASLAILSLLLMSWAYARAEAQMLIPVEYTAFVWAVLVRLAILQRAGHA
jgi:S-adenosylmethionine uptake transporter